MRSGWRETGQAYLGRSPAAWVTVCGAAFAALLLSLGRVPVRLEAHPWQYVPRYLGLFALYLLASASVSGALRSRTRGETPPAAREARGRRLLPLLLGFALLFRLLAGLQYPSLSTDLFRYLWDGRVGASGANPYEHPPSAREQDRFDPLDSGRRRRLAITPAPAATRWLYGERQAASIRINHPTWVTMYPPLSQRFFTLLYRLFGNNLWAFKLAFAAVDLACVGALLILLRRLGRAPESVIWYAWHPLPVVEVAGQGHQDVLGVFWAVVAIGLAGGVNARGAVASGVASALSLMSKGYLLPALPILGRRRPLAFLLGLVPATLWAVWSYMGPESQILVGLSQYAGNRLRNAGPYALADAVYSWVTPDHFRWARLTMLALLAATVAWLARRPAADTEELLSRATAAMAAFFLLSHTVYPWYGVWLTPLFCFRRHPAWMAFTALLPMAYLNPVLTLNPWAPLVEYGAVLGILAWMKAGRSAKSEGQASTALDRNC